MIQSDRIPAETLAVLRRCYAEFEEARVAMDEAYRKPVDPGWPCQQAYNARERTLIGAIDHALPSRGRDSGSQPVNRAIALDGVLLVVVEPGDFMNGWLMPRVVVVPMTNAMG